MAQVPSFLLVVNSIIHTWRRAKTAVNSHFNLSLLLEMVAMAYSISCSAHSSLLILYVCSNWQGRENLNIKKQLQKFGGSDVFRMCYMCALSWAALIMRVWWFSQMSRHAQIHGLLMKCYWRGCRHWEPKSLQIKTICDPNHSIIESLKTQHCIT